MSAGRLHRDTQMARVRGGGEGVPEELRPEVFGRFVRADHARSRATGSTGLGLAIVQAVITAHHGTVTVAGGPGRTTFQVSLPGRHRPAR
ncbi:ATP-binding protein [Streptomyces sp. NPDC048484]|uniref:ATP-binding protein n=1 Tax=Streptomyces sp. NPDC048484 TaxID=3155146 RepID=UPI0034189EEB